MDTFRCVPKGPEWSIGRNHCGYGRQATLGGIWNVSWVVIGENWGASLSQVVAETTELEQWGLPEKWEASWAAKEH